MPASRKNTRATKSTISAATRSAAQRAKDRKQKASLARQVKKLEKSNSDPDIWTWNGRDLHWDNLNHESTPVLMPDFDTCGPIKAGTIENIHNHNLAINRAIVAENWTRGFNAASYIPPYCAIKGTSITESPRTIAEILAMTVDQWKNLYKEHGWDIKDMGLNTQADMVGYYVSWAGIPVNTGF
ncbi:hypothetical protein TWF281_006783 [Arthrobotrys megalospora]